MTRKCLCSMLLIVILPLAGMAQTAAMQEFASAAPLAGDLLPNPSFTENADNWSFYSNAYTQAQANRETSDFDSAPAGYKVQCTHNSQERSAIQLFTGPLSVTQDRVYKLTFRAKSTVDCNSIVIRLIKNDYPYTGYSEINYQPITTTWQTYRLEITPWVTANDARLTFYLGGSLPDGAAFYIDSLSMIEKTTPSVIQGNKFEFLTKFQASDKSAQDRLGYSVSVSGDGNTALIGVYGDDDRGTDSGSAYIYRWESSTGKWQETKLVATNGGYYHYFGCSVSLSADGQTALIGAYGDDGNGTNTGLAYIYRWNSAASQWLETKLAAIDGAGDDYFGYNVSLSGDGNTALIGAPKADDNGLATGAAYIYRLNSVTGQWEEQKLVAADGAANDNYGYSVSLSGDGNTALIGAYLKEVNGMSSGAAYAYRLNSTTSTECQWQETKLAATNGAADDYFGYSVSLSADGNTALIGAYGDDTQGANSGSAYRYVRDSVTGQWQEHKLMATYGKPGNNYGYSVALSGDGNTALIGVSGDAHQSPGNGSAFIYRWTGDGNRYKEQKLIATNTTIKHRFGSSVALSADAGTALIGALGDYTYGQWLEYDSEFGSAYLFKADLLPNPDFSENANNWHFYKDANTQAEGSRDTNNSYLAPAGYTIQCNHSNMIPSAMQFFTSPLNIIQGKVYQLTFRAKSTVAFTIPEIQLIKNESPYSWYSEKKSISITTDWKPYSLCLTARKTANDARLTFYLGGSLPDDATFYIDSLSLVERYISAPPAPTPGLLNLWYANDLSGYDRLIKLQPGAWQELICFETEAGSPMSGYYDFVGWTVLSGIAEIESPNSPMIRVKLETDAYVMASYHYRTYNFRYLYHDGVSFNWKTTTVGSGADNSETSFSTVASYVENGQTYIFDQWVVTEGAFFLATDFSQPNGHGMANNNCTIEARYKLQDSSASLSLPTS